MLDRQRMRLCGQRSYVSYFHGVRHLTVQKAICYCKSNSFDVSKAVVRVEGNYRESMSDKIKMKSPIFHPFLKSNVMGTTKMSDAYSTLFIQSKQH